MNHLSFRPITSVILTLIFFYPSFSFAFAPPGDNDYLILEQKQYRIVFDRQYVDSIDKINQKIKRHLTKMSHFKNRTLDEKLTIILLSSKTQISNAMATVLPSFTIILYPTGIIGLHELAMPSYFEGVFEHELNHIFQLSHSKLPKTLKKLFNMPSLLYFYLYNPYPNIFMPRFILEGDSVLKESLFHYGGRLYNGYARALVYSQIKHYRHQINQFMKQNLLTFHLTPHSGKEKYLHGGYFMTMLAETYSHDTINSFFKVSKKPPSKKIRKQINEASVKKFLSPLFAEKFSFRSINLFLKSLTKSYFNRWLQEASKQKSSDEPVLFESAVCPAFGSKGDEIFFLTSDMKSIPMLRIFNKRTKKWDSKKSDLPLDKVFKINGDYYARSWQEIKPHTIHYSLFSEGLQNNKQFNSKYVQDLWKNKTLYIDPKNNLDGFKLYVNNLFYSDTHSNALFDKNGNIYFFKQKNKVRTLYKNKRPLFSYSGYYGSVLDIGLDGTVYFSGSSPYGSSVYQYKNGTISRSVLSDTVIQAKKINNREFIACEITPYGYEYKIISQKIRQGKPVLYKYKFKKRKPLHLVKNDDLPSKEISSDALSSITQKVTSEKELIPSNTERRFIAADQKNQTTEKYKEYSPLKHIRYKGGSFLGILTGINNVFGINFLFSDYLSHHLIIPGYITIFPLHYLDKGLHLMSLSYQNRTYPLEWQLGYQVSLISSLYYSASITGPELAVAEESSLDMGHLGHLRLNYPLFKKGRWFSSVSSLKTIALLRKSSGNSEATETKGLWRGQVNWGYSQFFPFNYAPNKASVFSVFFDDRYDFDKNLNGFKSGMIWDSVFHLGWEFYMFPSASYAWSLNPAVNPVQVSLYTDARFKDSDYENSSAFFHSSDPHNISFEDQGSSNFITGDIFRDIYKSWYKAKSIGTFSLGLKKAFNISLGESKSRFAPLMRVRYLILEDLLSYDTKTESSNNIVTFDDTLDKGIPSENIQKVIGISEQEVEKKTKKPAQYTQWLEWTFGLESEFIISNRARLILGYSYGFRTPLKFWEKDNSPKEPAGESSIGSDLGDIGNKIYEKSPYSAFTNIYLKVPL